MKAEKYEAALAQLEKVKVHHQECPYLWILRGDLIQLLDTQDGPPLKEAGISYRKAVMLDSNNVYAIESLAHFYDAIEQQPERARYYANIFIKKVKQSLSDMEQILKEKLNA